MMKKRFCAHRGLSTLMPENTMPAFKDLHESKIRCNLFYADDEENYEKYFTMGIDTLLTNRMDRAAEFRKNHPSYFK